MGEEINESLTNRGPHGSAVQWGSGDDRSRLLRRGVRESAAAAATCVWETPTPNVQEGDREALSLKKKTTELWPRRGRRELRQRYWSFFDGRPRSLYPRREAGVGGLVRRLGVPTPARFDG